MNNEEFVRLANNKHDFKYRYEEKYVNSSTKIEIICEKHGSFLKKPYKHLKGQGCPKCGGYGRTTEDIIDDFNKVHNFLYDYPELDFKNVKLKIDIKCKKCLIIFKQSSDNHLRGKGCPKCIGRHKTTDEFIKEANIVHNSKYIYEESVYTVSSEKISIKCKVHGLFEQIAGLHLQGRGCPKCSGKNKTEKDLISEFNMIHNNKYDYSKFKKVSTKSKIDIICPYHGLFQQVLQTHLKGSGCPRCRVSHGEKKINSFLIENNIIFEAQKKFENCKNKRPLPFDFYLPEHNTIIEYDGRQHYEPVNAFGGEDTLKLCKINDNIKTEYCINNGIRLIRISYKDKNKIGEILKNLV